MASAIVNTAVLVIIRDSVVVFISVNQYLYSLTRSCFFLALSFIVFVLNFVRHRHPVIIYDWCAGDVIAGKAHRKSLVEATISVPPSRLVTVAG